MVALPLRTSRFVAVGVAVMTAGAGLFLTLPDRQHKDVKVSSSVAASSVVSPDVLTYFFDLQKGLGPLLVHVRILPGTITALDRQDAVITTSQLNQAGYMAESFATARDLVGRVVVPKQVPPAVGELIQVACQLYRQSAMAITELRGASRGEPTAAVLRRAAALHELGDRFIDQVRRLLGVNVSEPDFEIRYVDPVPTVTAVTGQLGPTAHQRTSSHTDLESARHLLNTLSSQGADPAGSTVTQSLQAIATRLQDAKDRSDEDLVAARMAILLGILAADSEAHGTGESTDALLMLAHDVWEQARSLARAHRDDLKPLDPPKQARTSVWTGGVFNGNPPPLKPGEDIGSGVPGGLPVIDKSQILKD